MDPIVGNGQARNHFWMRVTKNYNFLGELHERAMNQLKSRWQKIIWACKSSRVITSKQYH